MLSRCLTGRMPGVGLNADGVAQAAAVTSLQQRCVETAAPTAERLGVLEEVDLGRWIGLTFGELDADPTWHD